jgi:hypothetical protein
MIGIARLRIDEAFAHPTWLTDDASARYQVLEDALDVPEEYVERVFELYQKTYQSYGPPRFTDSRQLLKYDRWILFFEGDDHDAKHMIAFALLGSTEEGLKAGLRGSDLSLRARAAVKAFAIGSYNTPGVYGEISERLEAAIIAEVPVVPFMVARTILVGHGKDIQRVADDDEHYTRELRNIGRVPKIMVGRPLSRR